MQATIETGAWHGWELLTLANEQLAVTVIPNRGGEVHSLFDKALDAELLWHPSSAPAGPVLPAGADFHEWYIGGWQSLLPNGAGPCVVDGVEHEQHGDSWHQQARVDTDSGELRLELASTTLPLQVSRRMRLRGRTLVVDEQVRNMSDRRARFMWGQHPALGGALVESGSRVDIRGASTHCYGPVDSSGRISPTGSGQWPRIPGRDATEVDLSVIPGPEARSHDVSLLTDLERGWYAVRNPRRGVGVAVAFPADLFRWLWMWQPFGGATGELSGIYALALEPWTSPPGLDNAVATGTELALEAGQAVAAQICVTVFEATDRAVSDVTAGGELTFE